jgi:hypothetical protein
MENWSPTSACSSLRSVVPVRSQRLSVVRAIDAQPIDRSAKMGITGFASGAGITTALRSMEG